VIRVATGWKSYWTILGCKVRRRKTADLYADGPRQIEHIELSCPDAPLAVEEYNEQTYNHH
jgi:hypothetical protein